MIEPIFCSPFQTADSFAPSLAVCPVTGKPRDPRWERESATFRVGKVCACCGSAISLEVHHIVPFHDNPALEMDQANWLVLCRTCHFYIAHLGNWSHWNTQIVEVCATITRQREHWKEHDSPLRVAA